MLIICYDISDNGLRTSFSKMLTEHGAIRLQYSVYEANNTPFWLKYLTDAIENDYGKRFGGGDSVVIFETDAKKAVKYGNAVHRDRDILYF